jgi:hypothetical protein
VEAPAALPEPAEAEASVNWEGLANEVLSDAEGLNVEGDVEVVDAGAAPEGFASTLEAPALAAAPTTPAAEPKVGEPAPAAAPAAQPVTEQPAAKVEEPFDVEAWEKEQHGKLESLYQLSEEEQTAFMTEPEKTLPKLAATLHMRITKAVLNSVQSIVPQIIQQHQTMTTTEAEAKNAFYSANPDLKDPAYEAAILQVGAMYRQMNPGAKREDAVKKIGELVRVSMGLPPTGSVEAPPAASAAPAAQGRPFTPARGAAGAIPQAGVETNEWAQLANEFIE